MSPTSTAAGIPAPDTAPRAGARLRAAAAHVAHSGLAAWLIVGVLVLGLTVENPGGFWAAANLANVLTATVVLGLVALGQHLVVLTGGIDLSVGSVATLSGLLTAVWIDGYPVRTLPVVLAVLLIGAAVGAAHGVLVARLGLVPFVVTLATFYLLQGIAYGISTVPAGQVTSALTELGLRRAGPFPYAVVVLAVAVAVVAFLLRRTTFGRSVFAVGGDREAARANGVPVVRTVTWVYVLAGVLSAAAGVVLAARATIGSSTAGQGLELSAITVVVVGGAALTGGRGRLTGTLGGVALLALVQSSVVLLQLPSTYVDVIRGAVILAAAAIFVTDRRAGGTA
jgi:ribose transport system permease protein